MRPGEGGGGHPARGIARAARAGLRRRVQHARAFHPAAMAMVPGGDAGGGGQPPVQPPAVDPYDPSADPTLQRIRAFGAQQLAMAQAAAINARTQENADYGDVQAGDTRAQHDQPIALSAQQSRENLGYSSAGAVQQSDLSRALVATAAQHSREHQGRLQGIQDALTGVQQDVASNDIQAQQDAADRLREQLGNLPVGQQQGAGRNVAQHARARTGPAARAMAAAMRRNRGRRVPHGPPPGGRQ